MPGYDDNYPEYSSMSSYGDWADRLAYYTPSETERYYTGGFPPVEPLKPRPVVTPEQAVSASESLMTPRYINTPQYLTINGWQDWEDALYPLLKPRPVVTPEQAVSASESLMSPRYINTPPYLTINGWQDWEDTLYHLMYNNGVSPASPGTDQDSYIQY